MLVDDVLDMKPKSQARKEKISWTSSELKTSASNSTIYKVKRQPTDGEKYLQIIYLNRDSYPECIKNSCNKKINNPIKNRQRI